MDQHQQSLRKIVETLVHPRYLTPVELTVKTRNPYTAKSNPNNPVDVYRCGSWEVSHSNQLYWVSYNWLTVGWIDSQGLCIVYNDRKIDDHIHEIQ